MGTRNRLPAWPALGLVLLMGGCESGFAGPNANQGIEGIVLIGPQCPVASAETPCPDLPFEASIEVRTREGLRVTGTRSGEDGRFRVGLLPGFYTLHPESGDPFPVATDQEVVVLDDAFTEVTVNFDTGIR